MSLAAVLKRSQCEREDWRYTDLTKLLPSAAHVTRTPKSVADDDAPRLFFLNGVWQPERSRGITPEGSATEGYRLTLTDNALVKLICVTDAQTSESALRLAVNVPPNAQAALIEHHYAEGATTCVIDSALDLGAGSRLVHNKIWHAAAAHLAQTRVTVARAAFYRNLALIKDAHLTRNEIDVTLAGEDAEAILNGAMLLRGHEHADTWTRITHAAPHGTSRQLYKTVLADQARGVFQGKIIVAEGAQKTDGRQLSRALLLSDQAEMDAKPELEIYADDVACSHGSTIGDLDSEALFYLRARGIDEATARGLLLRGFVGEVFDDLKSAEGRAFFETQIEEWLHDLR